MIYWRIGFLVVLVLNGTRCVIAAGDIATASLEISADAVQPSDALVLFELTVKNTGRTLIRFWWSGPADYPNGAGFVATLIGNQDPRGQLIDFANGQTKDASGRSRQLAPGISIHFPVALPPQPPGVYHVFASGRAEGEDWPATHADKFVTIQIRDDAQLAAERDRKMLQQIRANKAFAQFVAAAWPRKTVRDALAEDLVGGNIVAADRAVAGLWGGGPTPQADAPLVARAIRAHLKCPPGACDVGLMGQLLKAAKEIPSEELKQAIVELATARPDGHVSSDVAEALAQADSKPARALPAPPAVAAVKPSEEIATGEQVTIDALIQLATTGTPELKCLAYRMLADHPSNEKALGAIRVGVKDPDVEVHFSAEKALSHVLNYRSDHTPATQP